MAGKNLWLVYILCAITPALWSANSLVGRVANGTIEPHLLSLLRWSAAAAFMLPFAIRELVTRWPEWKKEWPDLVALACLGMWISGTSIYIGARTTQAVNISLIYSTGPVLIALVSAVWFGERFRLAQWAGVALALTGTLIVVSRASMDTLTSLAFTVGDWWIVCSALTWAAYSLIFMNRPSCLSVSSRVVAVAVVSVLILIPCALVEMSLTEAPVTLSLKALTLVAIVALLPSAGAYHAYAYIQQELGAARASVVLYTVPLYGALGGWVILGETLETYHFAAMAFVIPGTILALWRYKS